MVQKITRVLQVYIFILVLTACQTSNKNHENSITSDTLEEVSEQVNQELKNEESSIDDVLYLFPEPSEILMIIDDSELIFKEELLSPVNKTEEYIGSKEMTIHLGAYVADLAYIALFGKHEQAAEYLMAIHQISDQSHIKLKSLSKKKIEKLMNAQDISDSLVSITNKIFYDLITYLENNEREDAVSNFSVGAFIQSLYIAVNLVESYDVNNRVIQKLSGQKVALVNLMAYAEESKELDKSKYYALNEIRMLKMIFDECEFVEIDGTDNVVISRKDFPKLKKKINEIRDELI